MKNRKKFLFGALTLAFVLAAAGCGSGSSDTSQTADSSAQADSSDTTDDTAVSEGFVFEVDGVSIAMNAEADPIIEALGEYKSYFESESCAFEGLDKEYTYSGFVLTTYPTDDVDYVSTVVFVDDTVETPEGITIGSSYDDVIAAYGESDSETTCEYEEGDSQILILLEDGVVYSVQYIAITE